MPDYVPKDKYTKKIGVRDRSTFNPKTSPLNQSLPIRAIWGCLFVAGYCLCATCYTKADAPRRASQQTPTPTPCPEVTEDFDVTAAAKVLVKQLGTNDPILRDKAAAALQAMGKKAASALADQVKVEPANSLTDIQCTTKAVTILTKIGNDVANDNEVRAALLFAAGLDETKRPERPADLKSAVFQLRLAAIDALAEINKYRGSILPKEMPTPTSTPAPSSADSETKSEKKSDEEQLDKAKESATSLAVTAEKIFRGAANRTTPTPTPTPSFDEDFRKNLLTLHGSQAALVKLAGQVNAAASPPKTKAADSDFPTLSDDKALATSLRRIEVGYVDATKTTEETKLKLQNSYDKSVWQFRAEAAYDLLTETKQLSDQLDDLKDGVKDLKKKRAGLIRVICTLSGISSVNPDSLVVLRRAAGTALNAIFSKPPKKKKAAAPAKKDEAKKETAKTDTNKKDDDKKATDKGDSESKDSDKSDEDEEDSTDNE